MSGDFEEAAGTAAGGGFSDVEFAGRYQPLMNEVALAADDTALARMFTDEAIARYDAEPFDILAAEREIAALRRSADLRAAGHAEDPEAAAAWEQIWLLQRKILAAEPVSLAEAAAKLRQLADPEIGMDPLNRIARWGTDQEIGSLRQVSAFLDCEAAACTRGGVEPDVTPGIIDPALDLARQWRERFCQWAAADEAAQRILSTLPPKVQDPTVWIVDDRGRKSTGHLPGPWLDDEKETAAFRRRCEFFGASFEELIAELRAIDALDVAGQRERSGFTAAVARVDARKSERDEIGRQLKETTATTPLGFLAQLSAFRDGAGGADRDDDLIRAIIGGVQVLRRQPLAPDAQIRSLVPEWIEALRRYNHDFRDAGDDDPVAQAVFRRICDLEDEIAATPAEGAAGLAVKAYLRHLQEHPPFLPHEAWELGPPEFWSDFDLAIVAEVARFVPELAPFCTAALAERKE